MPKRVGTAILVKRTMIEEGEAGKPVESARSLCRRSKLGEEKRSLCLPGPSLSRLTVALTCWQASVPTHDTHRLGEREGATRSGVAPRLVAASHE